MIKTTEVREYLRGRGIDSYHEKSKFLYCLNGYLLKGIYFEVVKGHFYINSFYIPLVIPTSMIFFNYSKRLINPINNSELFKNEHFITAKGQILFLIFNAVQKQEIINSLDSFWKLYSDYRERDKRDYERFSYVEFLLNPYRKEEIISRLENRMKEEIPMVTSQWQQEIFNRIIILKGKSIHDAELQIETWKKESLNLLKID